MKDFYVGLRSQAYDDNSAIKAIVISAPADGPPIIEVEEYTLT